MIHPQLKEYVIIDEADLKIGDIIKVQLISSIQAPQINYKQKQIQIL